MSAFGTKRTSRRAHPMSAFGGKADIDWRCFDVRFWPKADMNSSVLLRWRRADKRLRLCHHYSARPKPSPSFLRRRGSAWARPGRKFRAARWQHRGSPHRGKAAFLISSCNLRLSEIGTNTKVSAVGARQNEYRQTATAATFIQFV